MAYIYWLTIPMGCLSLLMIHHLTGGRWGLPIRRIMEASSRTLYVMAILFIPIALGISKLYPWYYWPSTPNSDPNLAFKRAYLTPGFFTVRAVIYFVILFGIVFILNKWSSEQDRTGDPRLQIKMASLSGIGCVIFAFTVTGMVVDWVMSLEPDWFSTIYGFIFIAIGFYTSMAFMVITLKKNYEQLKNSFRASDQNDLGSFLLTFTILWAYFSFSQFLIIWAGNLKDEIPWFLTRAFGGWGAVGGFLLLFHFFVPFFLLLQRTIKRDIGKLSKVATWMMIASLVDVYWIVMPAFDKAGPHLHLMDIVMVVLIGAIWFTTFKWQLGKMPLLPLHDTRFEGVLEHEHGD
jgi:hypothetical protein